jgi:hypothetical protein
MHWLAHRTWVASFLDLPQGQIAVWLGVLLGALMVGLFLVNHLKKRLATPDVDDDDAGFSLSDLRRLHEAGEMSTEEFAKAKARVIEAARRAAERDTAGGASPRELRRPTRTVLEAKPDPQASADEDEAADDEPGSPPEPR